MDQVRESFQKSLTTLTLIGQFEGPKGILHRAPEPTCTFRRCQRRMIQSTG